MTKDQVRAVLERVPTWPERRQQQLAEIALEIEAELADAGYDATPDELTAIGPGTVIGPLIGMKVVDRVEAHLPA